ncbi:MAG: TonB-dependent receptor [Flavobacteriaceae bacterium]|nr:MAG: TonB-dependent receptor [Flavobacteriaceae bacterium]
MTNKRFIHFVISIILLVSPVISQAQTSASGKVTTASGKGIPFVTIIELGTSNGTISDENGDFDLTVSKIPTSIKASFIGFKSNTVTINSASNISIILQEDNVSLEEVVITGNRAKPRTILDSPVPIDNVGVQELKSSGQTSIDHMLTYKIPSYNSTQQTISDATAHFDPADLRGLGPSRTLVLINGKRKNQSALVYVNDTPGKGEVGTDMKSIPTAAIERVEVLRDGASAQYGSDAIAGVVNIILKKNISYSTVSITSGVTTEGDGFNIGADLNTTLTIGEQGFINFTLSYYRQEETNRAGEPGSDILFEVDGTNPWIQKNPDLGMTVGQPKLEKGEIFYNASFPCSTNENEFYTFGGLNIRKGTSYALYRTPYWVGDPYNLLHAAGTEYQGFQPTFETSIQDFFNSMGYKFDFLGFKADLSGTFGLNNVRYNINNTLNKDLGASSPTEFYAGGYQFNSLVGNFDLVRSFGDISIALGLEARKETFKASAGEEASYYGDSTLGPDSSPGAQSFPGIQPSNAVNESRNNMGAYVNLDYDLTEAFLIGGAFRYEDYSDFGSNSSWKINARQKLGSKGAIRASYSTGFRAPSLHQIYLSNIQTLVSGGTISNQGTFNNHNPIIRDELGVPQLHAETSKNISAGITLKPIKNLTVSADFYNVKVDDRVLFTSSVAGDGDDTTTNPVEQILLDNQITSMKFFINAVNTNTKGVDLVVSYRNMNVGNGMLDMTLSANWNETKIDGKIKTPEILAANGYDIFDRKEQSRITSARPKTKVLLGLDYKLNKLNINLNNTYFGEVSWKHQNNGLNGAPLGPGGSLLPTEDSAYDQVFAGKVITDLNFGYQFTKKLSGTFTVNNLLNVYPDVIDTKGDFVTDLGGRFKYPWEVNQFGFNGTIIKAGISYQF